MNSSETASNVTTIYLEDRQREVADLAGKIQHLIGGVPLLMIGIQNFEEGVERPIAILEIGIALILLVTFVREALAVRRHKHPHHSSHSAVNWFDLASGVLLVFEAFHSPHQKPAYLRPQFLSGMVMLTIGLFHSRLLARRQRRRYVKLDESGVEVRLSRFRGFAIARKDLASIDLNDGRAVFYRVNGKTQTLPLARMRNSEAVRRGLAEYARAAGVGTG